ncbi:MAG: NAD(P)H-hydrate dehydratase [Bacillota bacterium]
MLVLRDSEMAAVDKKAVDLGYPNILLMEAAGRMVAENAIDLLPDTKEARIIIVVGSGNNGGDGLVAARYLHKWGYKKIQVLLLKSSDKFKGITADNYNACHLNDLNIKLVDDFRQEDLLDMFEEADLLIDAIFGTGLTGPVRGRAVEVIEALNSAASPVLAVDLPSGLSLENKENIVKADKTVVFANLKLQQALYPGRDYCGQIYLADIGLPGRAYSKLKPKYFMLTEKEAAALLPQRSPMGHKGSFGKVLVVGGSSGMSGAPLLTGEAALNTGAGIVKLAVPEELEPIIAGGSKEIISASLPARDGKISLEAADKLITLAQEYDVLVLGPGLGCAEEQVKLIEKLMLNLDIPIVLDADGINALQSLNLIKNYQNQIVLTPHPGEMARLYKEDISEILKNRLDFISKFVAKTQKPLILKGADSLIGLKGGEIFINPTGNDGMATAGSGDVLAGVIAGLMAQGLDSEQAAVLSPFLHGRSGDLASEEITNFSVKAGNISNYIGAAIKSLKKEGG